MKKKYLRQATVIKGVLIKTLNGFEFRTKKRNKFVYYEILHDDLSITITEELAALYKIGDRRILDHSPKVLGINSQGRSKRIDRQRR